jgi:Ca2+-binding EF-hand superfamily protein
VDNFDEIEVYRTVFEVFDKDRSGFIEPNDLHEIAISLNKDPMRGKSLIPFYYLPVY